MLKYICAALLLLGTTSLSLGSSEDIENSGCTELDMAVGLRRHGEDLLFRCPNLYGYMLKLESYPIIADSGMLKDQVCSVPDEIDDCIGRFYDYFPCFNDEYKRALYVSNNITKKAAEVYCDDYEEIEKVRQDGLWKCSNVYYRDLIGKRKECIPEHNESGVCNGISSALKCIYDEAFTECSDDVRGNLKRFLQKIMDAVKTCPHVEI